MGIGIINRITDVINQIFTNPIFFLLQVAAVLLALTFHEYAHAYVANKCGDPTAKYMGRLTLNPLKHLDPIGTICLFFLGFGWAKPVPVNPRNYNNYRRDDNLVSVAGIATNFALYLVSTLLYMLMERFHLGIITRGNIWTYVLAYFYVFLLIFSSMNLGLAIFNLLPIPPYDGFHLFNNIFFKGKIYVTQRHMQIIQMVVLVLMFTGFLGQVLGFLRNGINSGVTALFSLILGGGA